MPIVAGLHLFIAIGLAVHAYQTGRPQFWYFILIGMPFVGSIAYLAFELMPEFAGTRRGRQVKQNLIDLADPDGEYRRLSDEVQQTGSADAKKRLAAECERKKMWADAARLYKEAAQGLYADDSGLKHCIARVYLEGGDAAAAERTLLELRATDPGYQSQEAHLIFARAIETQGRREEAAGEYAELVTYYAGLEARARFGLLLQKLGKVQDARAMFQDVVRASKARGIVLQPGDEDWLKVAKANT